jgi:hypothetical protein
MQLLRSQGERSPLRSQTAGMQRSAASLPLRPQSSEPSDEPKHLHAPRLLDTSPVDVQINVRLRFNAIVTGSPIDLAQLSLFRPGRLAEVASSLRFSGDSFGQVG